MKTKTIQEIKRLIDEDLIDDTILEQLKLDTRKGVKRLVGLYEKRQIERRSRKEQFMKMYRFDQQFRAHERFLLAGVDEAGRGPLAGPVVAAAVILPEDFIEIDLNDSKQLTEKMRKQLFQTITEKALSYSISVVHNDEIDRINILNATKKAMTTALNNLSLKPDLALIDAVKLNDISITCNEIVKGDAKSCSIAAASILAKVTRDEWMDKIAKKYPAYDFQHNKGYGTKTHLDALYTYGPTPYHRKSFSPVQELVLKKEGSS